jgi:hypothetical protein
LQELTHHGWRLPGVSSGLNLWKGLVPASSRDHYLSLYPPFFSNEKKKKTTKNNNNKKPPTTRSP